MRRHRQKQQKIIKIGIGFGGVVRPDFIVTFGRIKIRFGNVAEGEIRAKKELYGIFAQ